MVVVPDAGLLEDVETLHLYRGYDYPVVCCRLESLGIADPCVQRRADNTGPRRPLRLRVRWIVEPSKLLAVELRATLPQHRLKIRLPTRCSMPHHLHLDHCHAHRLEKPIKPHISPLSAQPLLLNTVN